ncbi:MAG: alpha/beta fold hydrolase [Gemmatimonadota bacterium]|nr:alpha/beta fold hydrolase [Gemmatimonadota bacterium]
MGRRRTRWIVGCYLLLLGASHLRRAIDPSPPVPDPDELTATLSPVAGEATTPGRVTIAYRDVVPATERAGGLPVVLLHGSPGDNGEVTALAKIIGSGRRAVAPDLPGFGGSTRGVPDYSIRAHARYVLALLDSLGIRQAHLVGFSMGGGVAAGMFDLAPGRVASLTLLSSIGAQEYELLGDYTLNHAIHAIQLAGLWLLREGVPHFGAWDGGMLTVEYARNFYDTDQRPLRGILSRYPDPVLIIQGERDPLVEPKLAEEHHRIIPQSELVMLRGRGADHFMAFSRPTELGPIIGRFLDRVENGRAMTRATAAPERLAAAARPFDYRDLPRVAGLALVVLLLLIAASTFVSEDLACIATGLMVGRGTLAFLPGTAACFAGIVLGDMGLFYLGRWLGRPAVQRAPLRWFLTDQDVERSSVWFRRRGAWLILATRFVPGTRLPTYFTAGLLRVNALLFLGAFSLAAALWTPLLVGLSALFGGRVLAAFEVYQRFAPAAVLAVALCLLLVVKLVVPLCSWRGRRLLLSRWLRLTRWEFWPRIAFYPPIAIYVLWLAVKYRSLTLFSAVNPAIPGGGFVGESKAEILQGLAGTPDMVARWRYLPASSDLAARLEAFRRFVREEGLPFPVVLKPDVGERGAGVTFVGSDAEAERYLARTAEPLIVQEYVPGVEFGVFYYRHPGAVAGRVFAITDKRFPAVTGDGHRSLEELILADARAVAMAPFFLRLHAARLADVPAAGAELRLVELGTHCKGSVFFDGEWVRTPALEAAIDRVSQGYAGFWFGRYDVRAPSVEALQQGQFKVLELNGATAEATSIYDPGNRLGDAYRVLRRQWAILFEIASQNAMAGARPATVPELVGLMRRHRQSLRAHVNT